MGCGVVREGGRVGGRTWRIQRGALTGRQARDRHQQEGPEREPGGCGYAEGARPDSHQQEGRSRCRLFAGRPALPIFPANRSGPIPARSMSSISRRGSGSQRRDGGSADRHHHQMLLPTLQLTEPVMVYEVVTSLDGADVLRRAKEFFAERVPMTAASREGGSHLSHPAGAGRRRSGDRGVRRAERDPGAGLDAAVRPTARPISLHLAYSIGAAA